MDDRAWPVGGATGETRQFTFAADSAADAHDLIAALFDRTKSSRVPKEFGFVARDLWHGGLGGTLSIAIALSIEELHRIVVALGYETMIETFPLH